MTNEARPDGVEVTIDEHLAAPPEEVFEYVTDRDRFPPGGEEIAVNLGEVVESEPPHRIAWRVEVASDAGSHPGEVEVTLTPDGGGTRVRVVHRTTAVPTARRLTSRHTPLLALAA